MDNPGAPWLGNGGANVFNLSRSSWSLAAIADCLTRTRGHKATFAFPDYMCNPSLWPLRQAGAKVIFYPIDPDTLEPDYRKCDELPPIDAFVLVHYFGKPSDAATAEKWARSRGAVLIEDAAHILRPIDGVGEHGDFVVYSPRKLLPIPDGAFLVVRTPSLVPEISASVSRLGRRARPTLLWTLRRSRLKRLIPEERHQAPNIHSDEPVTQMARAPVMSSVAAAMIAKTDLAMIARKRQQNAQAVLAAVSNLPGWTPVFAPGNGWIPHRLPMRCQSADVAEHYFGRMRAAGLVAETWPALAPELPASSSARRLRQTILLLPCHQHINPTTIGVI
jgi:dTDP-4-amino-4,6-dideoxygalactose transaminase